MKKFEKKTPDKLMHTPLNGEPYRELCHRYIKGANAELDRKEAVIRKLHKQLRDAKSANVILRGDRKELLSETAKLRKECENLWTKGFKLETRTDNFFLDIHTAVDSLRPNIREALTPDELIKRVESICEEFNRRGDRINELTHEGDEQSQAITELMAEVEKYRSQIPGEWTSVEGNRDMVLEPGTYETAYSTVDGGQRLSILLVEFPISVNERIPSPTERFRLITRLADFNPNTAPIEVRVGKYELPGIGIGEVVCIDGDTCCYKFPKGGAVIQKVELIQATLTGHQARFIGGGDDAE